MGVLEGHVLKFKVVEKNEKVCTVEVVGPWDKWSSYENDESEDNIEDYAIVILSDEE